MAAALCLSLILSVMYFTPTSLYWAPATPDSGQAGAVSGAVFFHIERASATPKMYAKQ
jgi:hypothetical protein